MSAKGTTSGPSLPPDRAIPILCTASFGSCTKSSGGAVLDLCGDGEAGRGEGTSEGEVLDPSPPLSESADADMVVVVTQVLPCDYQ